MCKWFTVEGLPGAGKVDFAAKFAEGTGVKNFGTGHLNWELERINEVLQHKSHYKNMKHLYNEGLHYLAMRNVDINDFFNNPNDPVHSCRMQGITLKKCYIVLKTSDKKCNTFRELTVYCRSHEVTAPHSFNGRTSPSSFTCRR